MGEERRPSSLFSSQQRSFKMGVRSPQAAELRAAIAEKLMEFLGNYSDDVLAEYIVVLVCNGKNQNQARDELRAFLGDKSAQFIEWLWHHLSEEDQISKPSLFPDNKADSTIFSNTNKECRISRTASQFHSGESSSVPLPTISKSEPFVNLATTNSSSVIETSDDIQRWNPDSNGALVQDIQQKKRPIKMISDDDHHNDATRIKYYNFNSSSEMVAGDEQSLNQFMKTDRSKSIKGHRHLSRTLDCLPVSTNMQSMEDLRDKILFKDKDGPKKHFPKAMNAATFQDSRRSSSVWDRLGKPCGDGEIVGSENSEHAEDGVTAEKYIEKKQSEQSLSYTAPIRRDVNGRAALDKNVRQSVSSRARNGIINSINNSKVLKRKRDCNEYSIASSSGQLDSEIQGKESSSVAYVEAVSIGSHPQPNKRSVPQLEKAEPGFNSSVAHTQIQRLEGSNPLGHTVQKNHHGHEEILDLKLKLKHVEMEMLKLRAKHETMSSDTKPVSIVASSKQGAQNLFDDIERRTIFVTNVHFAASKEELSLYFAKCGEIVNVVLLTDVLTGQPKGSAYVVFATKDSVENALSMSGTSFFSRIVKVMRKADVPTITVEPKQPPRKPSQPQLIQSLKKTTFQRQHSGTHLQWRRDQSRNGETSTVI